MVITALEILGALCIVGAVASLTAIPWGVLALGIFLLVKAFDLATEAPE